MKLISPTDFLKSVEVLASINPAYASGGDGSAGTCDCIGLIIGALRRCGVSWTGIHGSNWAIRHEVHDIRSITTASVLLPGALVFKVHTPDEAGWALPARYAKDPDQNDYYHVGIVTSAQPLRITHCTTGGIKTDTAPGRWSVTALLNAVQYTDNSAYDSHKTKGDTQTVNATVTSIDGNPVKLRPTASTSQPWICKLFPGTAVTVLERGETWSRIQSGNHTGWMMTQFLTFEDTGTPDTLTLQLPLTVAQPLLDALIRELGVG